MPLDEPPPRVVIKPRQIDYSQYPPHGFEKPDPIGVGPKCMCTSCGSELGNKKNFAEHIIKYLDDKDNILKMTCKPNTDAKQQRVNWYTAMAAEPKVWLKPKPGECPVCLETMLLSPFCYNEHLVCHECLPFLQICPLCRQPAIDRRHQVEAGIINPL